MSTEDYRDHTFEEKALVCLRCGSIVVDNQITKHDVWHAALAATPLIEENANLSNKAYTLEEQLRLLQIENDTLKLSLEEWRADFKHLDKSHRELENAYRELNLERADLQKRFNSLFKTVTQEILNVRLNTMDPMKKFYPYLDKIDECLEAVRRTA